MGGRLRCRVRGGMKVLRECTFCSWNGEERKEVWVRRLTKVCRSLKCPGFKDPGLASPYNSIRCYPDKSV
jgi:hypothetical protein